MKVCASEFVFENTPKWGEGVQSATPLPLPQYFNSKNFASAGFIFFSPSSPPTDKKQFHICVATALYERRPTSIFHTNCVLNPTMPSLDQLRAA